jgi:hypothetical protein
VEKVAQFAVLSLLDQVVVKPVQRINCVQKLYNENLHLCPLGDLVELACKVLERLAQDIFFNAFGRNQWQNPGTKISVGTCHCYSMNVIHQLIQFN